MIGAILGFLGSTAFGSITGLIGNFINQWQLRKSKKMEFDHEIAMAKVQIDILNAKTDAAIKINEAQIKGAVELEESKAYTTNIVVANQESFSDAWLDKLLETTGWYRLFTLPLASFLMFGFAIVDIIKGFMRPVLTLGFTAAFGYITYMSYTIIKAKGFETLTPEQAVLYFTMAVDTCVMLTATCVTWWYADRRMAKSLANMYEKRLGIESPKK
jgi:hypothetical protein